MGYRPKTTGQKLDFAGTEHDGLEVTVDAVSMAVALDVTELFSVARERTTGEAVKALRDLLTHFAGVLESWNVEHPKTGDPVPPDLGGLLSLPDDFVMFVIGAWLTGTTSAGDDLGKDSTSGGSSQEERQAMAALSRDLPSSSPQRLLSGCATGGRRRRTRSSRWTRGR